MSTNNKHKSQETRMVKQDRIAGFPVFIDRQGRQVSATKAEQDGSVRERFNSPHTDAAWARDLLGTPTQAEVRRHTQKVMNCAPNSRVTQLFAQFNNED